MNKKMVAEAYGEETSLNGATPASGNTAMGSSAVAASGIASVIHHAPMSTVVAATMRMVSAEYSTPSFAPEDCATVSAALLAQGEPGAALLEVAAVDPILDAGDVQAGTGFFHEAVAEINNLGEVMPGIDVEELERNRGRSEGAAG